MNTRPALDPDLVNALRELADGDPAFLHDLLEDFERNTAAITWKLRAAVIFVNRVEFGRAMHLLTNNAMNVGATDLTTICRDIELRMAVHGAQPCISDFDRVVAELNRVLFESRDLSLESYCAAVSAS